MNSEYQSYQRKIVPYLDGSMSAADKAEFEAFISTHPEFETQVRTKETEIELLRNMIPSAAPSKESLESIETEMRASIYNLVSEEPKGFFDGMRIKLEELLSR